jgi:polyisoprenoid-binding protein YceI
MKPQARSYRFLLCVLMVLASLLSGAQRATAQVRLTLDDESQLWIEGSSSVNTFTCDAGTIDGTGFFETQTSPGSREAIAEVTVPVRQFDCGKSRMNQDLYDALKAEAHPQIRFRLSKAELAAPATDTGAYPLPLHVTGKLTIAGAERPVTLAVQGQQQPNGTYRATGSLPLLMSDFGIDPPTALLGLIKAHDKITVRFNLIATPQASSSSN